MVLIDTLLDAVSLAFCEKGRRALLGEVPYGEVLLDVSRSAFEYMRKHGGTDDIRLGLEKTASCDPQEYQKCLGTMIDRLTRVQLVPFREVLWDYLTHFPVTIRQGFRRPTDPTGRTAPEKMEFYKAEQFLPFLPPRRAHFRLGSKIAKLDNWRLAELIGFGACSEVWYGIDDSEAATSPAALKFILSPELGQQIAAEERLLTKVFNLNEETGIVPLRSVYLDADMPCLESAFVYGYDLTGLMHDWHTRYDSPKPDAALKLIRRLAEVVGKAHSHGIVHRDLKPSNVIVHPGDGGKFSLWVTDWGWGQIESARARELARTYTTPKATQIRLAVRGSYSPLYTSPQQEKNEKPDTRDDVYSLGVIWFQLLKRDPTVYAPVGGDWAEEFFAHGFTPSQANLLSACVASRAERRPGDGRSLSDLLRAESHTSQQLARVDLKVTPPVKPSSSPQSGAFPAVAKLSDSDNSAAEAAAAALSTISGSPILVARSNHEGTGGSGLHTPFVSGEKTADGKPKLIRNSLGMTFTYIPAGPLEMGGRDEEPGRKPHETPRHPVRFAQPFYLSLFPVTQTQYERLLGKNPAYFSKSQNSSGNDLPVEMVTWFEAERFCQKLMQLSDENLADRSYRLPTEAEWEYACRAGTATAYSFGDDIAAGQVHCKGSTWPSGQPHPVGRTPANLWGLHEMHGNIGEWCNDWYEEYYYYDSPGVDPLGPPAGDKKIVRGGSWADPASECRSAARQAMAPTQPCNTIGFRVVMILR